MFEYVFQRLPPIDVDDRASAVAVSLLLPEVTYHVGDHHLVPYVPGLGDLLNLRIEFGIDSGVFAIHERGPRKQPSKAFGSVGKHISPFPFEGSFSESKIIELRHLMPPQIKLYCSREDDLCPLNHDASGEKQHHDQRE
jgi:hypothetical protein